MPAANEAPAVTLAQRSRAVRLVGLAGTLITSLVILACATMLAVRYLVLPQVETWRPEIAERLSREIGAPVAIDAISTGWDGWNPQVTVSGLRISESASADARAVLTLPVVSATISWLSLLAADLRLQELVIERPELTVTRLANGRVRIAGFEIDPEAGNGDGRLGDWVLRQREIVVRDALVTWNDERRKAPQLLLDHVQFRLEHPLGSRRHRFGLTGSPPAEVSSPIDLRGEFSNADANDWSAAEGRMYLRMDYADLGAWAEWIPVPIQVADGRGAMRLWLEFQGGAMHDLTADLELADVRTRMKPELPWLELARVSGRVTWHGDHATRRIETRDLALVARAGAVVTPMDFTFEAAIADDGSYRSGRANADVVELAPLVALAGALPMPATLREDLAKHAPRGTLRNARYRWEGPIEKPASYSGEAEAIEVGLSPVGAVPGVTGLTARLQGDERGGSARLGSKQATLSLPRVFAAPVAFDTLTGNLRWRRDGERHTVEVDNLAFANPDAAGTASGSWTSAKTGAGTADINARLTRADLRGVQRYLPAAMHESVRGWLRRAITSGTSEDVRVTLKGDLDKFPFPDAKQGTFAVAVKAKNATLDYADGWPAIGDLEAEVRFEGTRLTVDARRARILGAQIGPTKATIENLSANVPHLVVDGEASGPTTEFLDFVNKSPVSGWTNHALAGVQATGNGRLKLRFDLPLGEGDKTSVAGEYVIATNQLRMPGVPVLSGLDGRVAFTDAGVTGTDLAAEVYGGPAKLSIATSDAGVRVTGRGTANLMAVRSDLPDLVADRVSGSTDWTLALEAKGGRTQWTVDSSLRGAAVDLPAPVGKVAGDSAPMRIERRPDAKGTSDSLNIEIARVGRALVHRQIASDAVTVERVLVLLGKAAGQPASNDRAGIWVHGDLPAFNLDDWLALRSQLQARTASGPGASRKATEPVLRGVDLETAMLQVFGRRFNDVKASARSTGDDWKVQLTTRETAGTADWKAATPSLPNGRLVARMQRMSVPDEGELTPWQGADPAKARGENEANPWPEMDVRSEALISKGRDLGRFEVIARPQATDWRIEKMTLTSDAGQIQAEGWWRAAGRTQTTRLDVSLNAPEAAPMLRRFGFPDALRGASTRIGGQLEWPGGPSDFEPALLSGTLDVEVGPGQFTKIDPGIGKLLGVLSLQALPRRLTLDFRDVFSEGFAFDVLAGKAKIVKGVISTDDLRLVGPAAKVDISGEADLAKETQRLTVRVLPSLSTTFSAGTAGAAMLLLAANPLVAAAVGAGTLLAQKVMKDPLEQMFAYDYRVSGSWSDPVVERVGARAQQAAPGTPATPPSQAPPPASGPAAATPSIGAAK